MSSTTGLYPGQVVTGTGIPTDTTIISVDSASQITISNLATATNSGITVTCLYSVYDVYLYDNSGTITLELVAWTDNDTRATTLTTQDGIQVKSGDATRRYLGMMKLSGSARTEVGGKRCLIWNLYNQVEIELLIQPTGASWNYTTDTWRPWHKLTTAGAWAEGFGIRIEVVQGLDLHGFSCQLLGIAQSTAAGTDIGLGVNVDGVDATVDSQVQTG
jgi:hypothetical protein